jgi:hypothetical protein
MQKYEFSRSEVDAALRGGIVDSIMEKDAVCGIAKASGLEPEDVFARFTTARIMGDRASMARRVGWGLGHELRKSGMSREEAVAVLSLVRNSPVLGGDAEEAISAAMFVMQHGDNPFGSDPKCDEVLKAEALVSALHLAEVFPSREDLDESEGEDAEGGDA